VDGLDAHAAGDRIEAQREPSPVSQPGLVTKSTFGMKRRFSCAVTMMISRQSEAMSLAPPVPGSRTFGFQ
jgi:hypothetical protein